MAKCSECGADPLVVRAVAQLDVVGTVDEDGKLIVHEVEDERLEIAVCVGCSAQIHVSEWDYQEGVK